MEKDCIYDAHFILSLSIHSKNKICVLGNAIPVLGMKPKQGVVLFWLFFKVDLCSALSFKRYRRELSFDEAEHVGLSLKMTKIRTTPVL